MELRKGLYDGDFYNFIEECSNNELFTVLCPISEKRKDRGEAQELILRYFAYADNYQAFVHSVEDFIDDYMKSKHETGFDRENMLQQFVSMLNFVNQNFPYGFRKSENSSSIARTGIDGGNETVRTCKSCEKLSKYSGNPAFGLHFGKGSFGRKTVGFIMESIARKNLFSRSPFAAEREKRQNGQQMENYY